MRRDIDHGVCYSWVMGDTTSSATPSEMGKGYTARNRFGIIDNGHPLSDAHLPISAGPWLVDG